MNHKIFVLHVETLPRPPHNNQYLYLKGARYADSRMHDKKC